MRYLALLLIPLLTACPGTFSAYRAAEDLEDTAFVLSEHYDALVVEGIRLRDSGTLNGATLATAQRVELKVRPIILKLGEAARAWEAVKSAENEAALQLAVSNSTKALHELIDALKAGRSPSAELQRIDANLAEVA